MEKIDLNMHNKSGKIISLSDILKSIGKNNWCWKIYSFEGVGEAPFKMTMTDFENMVEESAGYKIDWNILLYFSEGLEQTINCRILAVDDTDRSKIEISISAFDSTFWEVVCYNEHVSIIQKIRSISP